MPVNAHWTSGDLVRVDPGIAVPREFTASVTDHADSPYDLELDVVLESGRYVVRQLCCSRKPDGRPVTSEGLRAVPVSRVLGVACAGLMFEAESGNGSVTISPRSSFPDDVAARGPTDEALRFVAMAYRYAYLVDEPPTQLVMNSLKLSRSTAGRWVMLARKRGFLGPAEARKPGEVMAPKAPKKGRQRGAR